MQLLALISLAMLASAATMRAGYRPRRSRATRPAATMRAGYRPEEEPRN
ncbi:hypothetical protein I552_7800 [Mycobacterium xenopi 3993]|nr:hypothetical protein I552_7800 [Mycobacterium xenopi 3993]